jgi:hypothetical protein
VLFSLQDSSTDFGVFDIKNEERFGFEGKQCSGYQIRAFMHSWLVAGAFAYNSKLVNWGLT